MKYKDGCILPSERRNYIVLHNESAVIFFSSRIGGQVGYLLKDFLPVLHHGPLRTDTFNGSGIEHVNSTMNTKGLIFTSDEKVWIHKVIGGVHFQDKHVVSLSEKQRRIPT